MDALGIPKRGDKGTVPTAQNQTWDLNIQRHDADRAGCFMPSTRITMSDGKTKYIRDIKKGDQVLTYNLDSKKLEPKKVLRIWENGNTDIWHKIFLNSRNGLTSTSEHKIFVYSGKEEKIVKKKAKDIKIGSDYLLKEDKELSEDQRQFILGSLMGDGSIIRISENDVYFSWGQAKYKNLVERISNIFGSKTEIRPEEENKSEYYYFRWRHKWLIELTEKFYPNNKKEVSKDILKLLKPQAIAQWYMDDGQWSPAKPQTKELKRNTKRRKDLGRNSYSGQISLYTNGFSKRENEIIANWFYDNYKIKFSVRSRYFEDKNIEYFYLVTNSIKSNKNFFSLVSDYVQPEFSYKIVDFTKDQLKLDSFPGKNSLFKIRILKKEEYKTRQGPHNNQKLSIKKYDLEIEDNHNYFASGCLVSNSHYDIRISPPGAQEAYSWATRRLPSPGEKTTAVRTDVHKRSYMGFSGTIDKGYGKGKVQSLTQEKIEVLKANDDKVEFNRYSGAETERYILLRKPGTDDYLFYNYTPTENTKVFKDVPQYKTSYPTLSLPELDPNKSESQEVWSPKLDGAHNIIVLRGNKTPDIFSYRSSRKGDKRIDHTYKTEAYKDKVPKEFKKTILRGELYIPGQPGNVTAGILNSNTWKAREKQKQIRPLEIRAFDVVKWKGKNVEDMPYKEKLKMLKEVQDKIPSINMPPLYRDPMEKKQLLQLIQGKHHPLTQEGIVVYRMDEAVPRKAKLEEDYDGKIIGTFPSRKGSKYHKNAVGGFIVQPEGTDTHIRIGSGLDDELRREAFENPHKFIGEWAKFKSQRVHPSGKHQAPILKEIRTEKFEKLAMKKLFTKLAFDMSHKNLSEDKKNLLQFVSWSRREPKHVLNYIKDYKDSYITNFEVAEVGKTQAAIKKDSLGQARKELKSIKPKKLSSGHMVINLGPIEKAKSEDLRSALKTFSEPGRKKILGLHVGPKTWIRPYADKVEGKSKEELLKLLKS